MKQRFVQSTLAEILIQSIHGIIDAGGGFRVVEACFHEFSCDSIKVWIKPSEDRKMQGRKMFMVCSLPGGEHCFDDTKLHFSVCHFSVFAFVQANLTLSS